MDFREAIRQGVRDSSSILEIGPSHSPIVPKAQGFKVTVFDHATREWLRAKYEGHGVDLNRIEEVDVVGTDVSLLAGHRFEAIVTSHMVEHTTDLLKFLNDCEALLSDNGRLYLIVPDKRFCFDLHRPLTSTGHVLDAHAQRRSNHLGAFFDQCANAVKRDGHLSWLQGNASPDVPVHDFAWVTKALNEARTSPDYTDAHEWVMVPSSLRLILQDLAGLGLTRLVESAFHQTVGSEFFIVLSKNQQAATPHDRFTLLRDIEAEQLAANQTHLAQVRQLQDEVEMLRAQLATPAPLRHVLVDRLNDTLKESLGPLQRVTKTALTKWVGKK